MGDFAILIEAAEDAIWYCQLQIMPLHKRIFWGIFGRTLYRKIHKNYDKKRPEDA